MLSVHLKLNNATYYTLSWNKLGQICNRKSDVQIAGFELSKLAKLKQILFD